MVDDVCSFDPLLWDQDIGRISTGPVQPTVRNYCLGLRDRLPASYLLTVQSQENEVDQRQG